MSHRTILHAVILCLILGIAFALSGCEHVRYYGQAIGGHFDLMSKRRPIVDVIEDPATPPRVVQQLQLVRDALAFADEYLALPTGKRYTTYVDIGRPYVVWNVFAAPEFSLTPVTWCYPVAGCVSYRGYFDQSSAHKFAQAQREAGLDVYVGGTSAYSTLGWFDDPVLSTFLTRSDDQLVALIFHELSHSRVYVKGDTTFNESFATAVEEEGLRRWMSWRKLEEGSPIDARRLRHQAFVDFVLDQRRQLNKLYASDLPEPEMRREKAVFLAALPMRYERAQQTWPEGGSYRGFFSDVNNARLATVGSYHQWVNAFQQLLADENYDFRRFFERSEELAELEKQARNDALRRLESAFEVRPGDAAIHPNSK